MEGYVCVSVCNHRPCARIISQVNKHPTYTIFTEKLHPKQQGKNTLTAHTATPQCSQHFARKERLSAFLFTCQNLSDTSLPTTWSRPFQERILCVRRVCAGMAGPRSDRAPGILHYSPARTFHKSGSWLFLSEVDDLRKYKNFCSSLCTSFDWKSFLGAEISGQKEYSHQNSHPVIMKQQQLCFKPWLSALLLTCHLLSYKRMFFLIQLNFGVCLLFVWGFFPGKKEFQSFHPSLSATAADRAVQLI